MEGPGKCRGGFFRFFVQGRGHEVPNRGREGRNGARKGLKRSSGNPTWSGLGMPFYFAKYNVLVKLRIQNESTRFFSFGSKNNIMRFQILFFGWKGYPKGLKMEPAHF